MDRFADLKSEMEELRRQMQERGKEVFRTESANLFNDFPDLVSFSWRQYTPYFNDGDECVFSVQDYPTVEFSDGDLLEDWSSYSRKYQENENETHMDAADAVQELVSAIPEEVMKDIFGDHVSVTVYKDRVDVDEYDHE